MDWPRALCSLLNALVPTLGIAIISQRRKEDFPKYVLLCLGLSVLVYLLHGIIGFRGSPYELLAGYILVIAVHLLVFRKGIFTSVALAFIPVPLYFAAELIAFVVCQYALNVNVASLNPTYLELSAAMGIECVLLLAVFFTVPLHKLVARYWEVLERSSVVYINIFIAIFTAKPCWRATCTIRWIRWFSISLSTSWPRAPAF